MNSFFVNSGFVCGYFGQFPGGFGPVVRQLSVAFRGDASLAEQWLTRMEKEAPLDSLRTLENEKFHWILQDGATSYKLVYTPMKTIIISTTNHS